jgi:2',3'-cyclic-nucleotide 2'-phosphodiesterase (5'-nucleotidase family)
MKQILGRALLALLFFGLATGVFAREVPITILHTTDLHGYVLPSENYEGATNLGGLAWCVNP